MVKKEEDSSAKMDPSLGEIYQPQEQVTQIFC